MEVEGLEACLASFFALGVTKFNQMFPQVLVELLGDTLPETGTP